MSILGSRKVWVWDGDSYEATGGRSFVGPNDPVTEGFTMNDGDEWIEVP